MADFKWQVLDGVLEISTQDADGDWQLARTYLPMEYPKNVRRDIFDFGCKALFQARASQVDTDGKLAFWDKLDALFRSGAWEFERTRGAITVAPWVEALAAHTGSTVAAMQKKLAGYDKEQRAKLRANVEAKLAKEIAELAAASAIDISDFEPSD